ncbi:GCN5 family acetyltransferase [Clostridium carboxidivorans P7]|uniref:GCN5-related N-acetyltransferase n=1 Tax=Clostridium carboxidivorans P7 TaxID=536227 RepID=C6PUA1_9CLOT|nr:GNAT family N-acetyltransferase [Clostridium carboxidivorans]AKN31356.1 GCN5 family acetyltransferase [Clostridium carboxidivorans P7]EET87199.1 GCN5-related N-acetyltransferase [Clostridium carboxidivorans P7]EFG87252.1 acetyltransferase, GNAT family [Clostridium carboxidivorans P7]
MMKLETKRLTIIPLNLEQFNLMLKGMDKMENVLGLNNSYEILDDHTQKAMEWLYKEAEKHKENYLWYTNWQIILKKENVSIGSACFMGQADESGAVEIGYGINEKYRCNGYMTEAVGIISKWALREQGISRIIALTEKDNFASEKVLQKCGFVKYKEDDVNNEYFIV